MLILAMRFLWTLALLVSCVHTENSEKQLPNEQFEKNLDQQYSKNLGYRKLADKCDGVVIGIGDGVMGGACMGTATSQEIFYLRVKCKNKKFIPINDFRNQDFTWEYGDKSGKSRSGEEGLLKLSVEPTIGKRKTELSLRYRDQIKKVDPQNGPFDPIFELEEGCF